MTKFIFMINKLFKSLLIEIWLHMRLHITYEINYVISVVFFHVKNYINFIIT